MSSSFRVQGPRTYRKKFPGKHVLVLLAVSPGESGSDLLIEGAVSKEFYENMIMLFVEDTKIRNQEQIDAGTSSDHRSG